MKKRGVCINLRSIILILSLLYIPFVIGVQYDNGYTGLKYASSDFNPETGLVYQGVSDTEKIFQGKAQLSIQGKQKGSVNIIDYNNDGVGDLFTTGQYGDINQPSVSTDLYASMQSRIGGFTNIKDSDSCWSDFDNNGFLEPVIVGSDRDNNYFEVYKNKNSQISLDKSLGTLSQSPAVECLDYDNDGWVDIVVCGWDESSNAKIIIFRNNQGSLEEQHTFTGVYKCDITINEFSEDDKLDILASGQFVDEPKIILLKNSGSSFSQQEIQNLITLPSLSSGDYDNNGFSDFIIAGHERPNSRTVLYRNLGNNNFEKVNQFDLFQLQHNGLIFLDYNMDNSLDIFQTGEQQQGLTSELKAQIITDLLETQNSLPSPPISLSYLDYGDGYLKLQWLPSTDDHTQHLFFHVRAGTETNPNQFLSGFLSDEKGNAQLTQFKILKNPNQCFFFQVKAIDGALAESDWSEKFYINCGQQQNETNQSKPPEQNETLPDRWYYDRTFDLIKYHAVYEKRDSYTSLTETINNEDNYQHDNILLWHEKRYEMLEQDNEKSEMLMQLGEYAYFDRNGRYELPIGKLAPKQSVGITVKLEPIEYNKVLPTQINSGIVYSEVKQQNLTHNITVLENKTIIKFDIKLNETTLAAEEVTVKQTIPKCLIKKINELIAKSNRKFTIVNEDPVIMWYFDSIVTPETLQLEIDAAADENCTNQITTEIIAKKFLIQKDELNMLNAIVLLVTILFLTLPIYFFVKNAKKQQRRIALIIFAVLFIILNIFDTLGMLPESLDFFEKVLSWVWIIALLYHLALKETLFTGKKEHSKFLNIVIIISFTLLSISDIIFVAFKTYGKERLFSDLLLPIIKYSKFLELWFFFIGIIFILLLALWITIRHQLASPSFAALIHKTEYEFISSQWRKPLYVLLILLGFYLVFFSFLFDWFSIAFDGPMLIILLFVVIYFYIIKKKKEKIEDIPEEPDTFTEKFIKLFTNEKNLFIAFSALPLLIFVVEIYNYLVYMLFGIRSVYFENIVEILPTISALNINSRLIPLYILQFAGIISAIILAFLFWWHFFVKTQRYTDKPKHPFLFSVFVAAFISYLVKPIFTISTLDSKTLAGILIILNQNVSLDNLTVLYIMLSFVFVMSYLLFKDTKKANILPYGMMLFSVFYITILFIDGYYRRINFSLPTEISMASFNMLFLFFMSSIYIFILLFSLYALIGEFFALINEEFQHNKLYKKIMLAFFSHKISISEDMKQKIRNYMEHMLNQGEEEYLIIEQIHEKTHLPLKEITKLLKETEQDDEQKQIYHQIHHYHHNLSHIKKLHKIIKLQYYRKKLDAETIIDNCLKQGWTQDDIAAAMMHLRYKKQDKDLFEAMKKVGL